MQVRLAYGHTEVGMQLADDAWVRIVEPRRTAPDLVRMALAAPMGSPPLRHLVRPGQTVAIVTSDISRPCPSHLLLPAVLDDLAAGGVADTDITVVLALGTHRPHTAEERRQLVGNAILQRVRCVDSDPLRVVRLGTTTRGTPVDVFAPVAEADVRVALGNVEPHYFAGYSGGAKAIVPGVSSAETIRRNHSLMTDPNARAGLLDGNPVREDIEEAVQLVGLDFILNVILGGDHEIVAAAAGHPQLAHRWLCQVCEHLSITPLDAPADLVIVGTGGFPKDINLYQAQKALDNAASAVRPGGSIVWVAECPDGLGSAVLAEWLVGATADEILARFARGFVLGGHKAAAIARIARHARIELVSSLPAELLAAAGIRVHRSVDAAITSALEGLGRRPSILVLPEAGSVVVNVASSRAA